MRTRETKGGSVVTQVTCLLALLAFAGSIWLTDWKLALSGLVLLGGTTLVEAIHRA